MKYGLFEEYMAGLFKDVPCYVYEGLLGVFVVSVIVLFSVKSARDGWRWSAGLLLLEYVILIYCSTVVFREPGSEIGHDFTPFWSYETIFRGEDYRLLPENVMNVVVFVPVGVLVGFMVHSSQDSQARMSDKVEARCMVSYGWLIALLVGLFISVSIEAFQFFLHRGFAEVDDLMHNTLGCVIGYGIYKLICSLLLKFRG